MRRKHHFFISLALFALIFYILFPLAGRAADPVADALSRCAQSHMEDRDAIETVFRHLDITTKADEAAFLRKVRAAAKGVKGVNPGVFENMIRAALDKKRFDTVDTLLKKVYARYGKDLDVVVRTGSSGIRHLELAGKRRGHAGYRLLFSDDDISFVGKKAVQAAKYFNQLVEKEGLAALKVKGFDIVHLKNIRGIDLHLLNLLEEEKFVGEAAMAGIKKEMMVKGAVIAENEGGKLVPHAESLSSYIKDKASGILANEFDEKLIREAVRKYGAMTMVGSCERQVTGAHGGWEKLSDPEKVKYVLRERIALEESGALGTLAKMSPDRARQQIEHLKRLKAKGKLTKRDLRWLRKLRANNIELVFEHIPYKLNPIIAKARASGRSLAGSPEARKALDELTVGFVLMREHILDLPDAQILAKLREMAGGNRDLYKMLYTSFKDGKELSAALDAWLGAGLSREAFVELLLKAEGKLARLRLINERRAILKKGGPEAKALLETEAIVTKKEGNKFLSVLLKKTAGRKLFIAILGAAGGTVLLQQMHNAWVPEKNHWDLSDSAFALIDFVPGGMSFKNAVINGVSAGTVFSFVKEALYFSPAWPLVLIGDVAMISVDIGSSLRVSNNNNGLIDILVYAGEYGEDGHFKRLVLPKAAANQRRVIDQADLEHFFFETGTVVVPVSGMNKTYRISDLTKVSNEILDQVFLENDPVVKQLRQAASQQLKDISHFESWARIKNKHYFSGIFEYAKWLTGFSTICEKSPEKWCQVFSLLKKKIVQRRKFVRGRIMIPSLVRSAEEKHAHWAMGTKPPVKKLAEIQKRLEDLRGKPLGIDLAKEVGKRADKAAAKAAGNGETREVQTLASGRYWQAALAAYTGIARRHEKMVRSVSEKFDFPTEKIRRRILRFPWSGDYEKDARSAAASLRGFYHGGWRAWLDVKKIKGGTPVPREESIDRQALNILVEVQLRWRMALDYAGSPGKSVSTSREFKKSYPKALAKVGALYKKKAVFQALVEKEATIIHGKLVLGKQARFAVKINGKNLRKIQNGRHLWVEWRSAHGDFGSRGRGTPINFATTRLLPVTVEAVIRDMRAPLVKGVLSVKVPVRILKGTFRLALTPAQPAPGEFVRAEVEMPDRYLNACKFHYTWRGKGCRVEGRDSFRVVVTAPKKGKAAVFVKITAEDKKGKRIFLADAGAALGVGKKGAKSPPGKDEEKTGKAQKGETEKEKAATAQETPSPKQGRGIPKTGKKGANLKMFAWHQHRFAGSAPKEWILDTYNATYSNGFSLIRRSADVNEPEKSPCRGVSVAAKIGASFPDYGGRPPSLKEILSDLKKYQVEGSKIVPYSLGGFKGYLLERKVNTGEFDGMADLVGDGERLELRYRVQTTVYQPKRKGCDTEKYLPFVQSETQAALREIHAIMASLRIVKEGGTGASDIPEAKTEKNKAGITGLRLSATPGAPWFPGDKVTIRAKVSGGKTPYHYRWSEAEGKKNRAVFTCRDLGKHTVTLQVTDANGDSKTGSIVILVKAPEFEITGLPSRPVYASTARLRVRVKGGEKGRFKPIWQASEPGIAFDPPEGMETTVTFGRVKKIAVWVQVPMPNGGKTLESKQVHAQIVGPKFTVTLDPKEPYVGQEVRAEIKSSAKVPPDAIRWVWASPPSSNRREYDDPASRIGFVLKTPDAFTLQAEARVPHYGDVIGKIQKQVKAKPYDVKVKVLGPLGPKPRIWKEGKGLVETGARIAVHQNVRVAARVTPKPKGTPLRYDWKLNEDSHFAGGSSSREITVNRSRTGACVAEVTVRDKNGVVLGKGKGTFSVEISQEEINQGKNRKVAHDLFKRARSLYGQKKCDEALDTLERAANLAPENGRIKTTLEAWRQAKALGKKLEGEGALLEAADDLEGAVKKYRESLKKWPNEKLSRHVAALKKTIAERAAEAKKEKEKKAAEEKKRVAQNKKKANKDKKPLSIEDVLPGKKPDDRHGEKPLSIEDVLPEKGKSGKTPSSPKAAGAGGGKPLSIDDILPGKTAVQTVKQPGANRAEKRRDALIREGYAEEKAGRFEAAIGKYKRAQEIRYDKKVAAHIRRLRAKIEAFDKLLRQGYGYEKKGHLSKAIAAYKKALKIHGDKKVAARIRALERKMAGGAPPVEPRAGSSAASAGATTLRKGIWVLDRIEGRVGRVKKARKGDYYRDMVSGGEGRIVMTNKKNGHVIFKSVSAWQRPPARLVPKTKIAITLVIRKLADPREYSVNHGLSVAASDLKCGFISAGESIGGVGIYSVHSPKNPAVKKTFRWKVPEGRSGKKLTLRFCWSGISYETPHGWKYHYRWVPAGTPLPKTGIKAIPASPAKKKPVPRASRTKTLVSSKSAANSRGDVFKKGHWAGARGGSDWIQKNFSKPYPISKIYIKRASTDVTTRGFRLILKLRRPDGTWVVVDKLKDININRSKLSGGRIGVSIPPYTKKITPPITATAFRLEFHGHGWFDASDIRLYTPKKKSGKVTGGKRPWTGTYRYDLNDPEGSMSVVLVLRQSGNSLTGTIRAKAVSARDRDLNFDFRKKVTGTCSGNKGRLKMEGQPSDKAVLYDNGRKLALYDQEDNKKYVLRRVK